MYAATFHSHASTNGVNAVIIRLNSNLCSFSGYACDGFDSDESIIYFGHFQFKKALHKHVVCTRKYDLRIVVDTVHTRYDRTDSLAFSIIIGRDLLRLRQDQFVAIVVKQKNFFLPSLAAPYLIYIGSNNISDPILILCRKIIFL